MEWKEAVGINFPTDDLFLILSFCVCSRQDERSMGISYFVLAKQVRCSQDLIGHCEVFGDFGEEDQCTAVGRTSFRNHPADAALVALAPEGYCMQGFL